MSDKNLLNTKFKDLIIIQTDDGKVHSLWGLVKATRDKRQQWQFDQDYIPELRKQLTSSDTKKVKEAKEALLFLNASVLAELDGNFNWFKELGIEPSDQFKRDTFNARNAAQRDFVSNNSGAQDELSDFIDPNETLTLGEMMDRMKETKKRLRKEGKSVSELHNSKDKKERKQIIKEMKKKLNPIEYRRWFAEFNGEVIQPVKKYSPEELAKFNQEYFKKDSKK